MELRGQGTGDSTPPTPSVILDFSSHRFPPSPLAFAGGLGVLKRPRTGGGGRGKEGSGGAAGSLQQARAVGFRADFWGKLSTFVKI